MKQKVIHLIYVCVHEQMCTYACAVRHMWRSVDSLHLPLGLREPTQATRLGSKYLYLLSHPAGPSSVFLSGH